MAIEIGLVGPDEHAALTVPLLTAFGLRMDPERLARVRRLPELVHRIAARDGGTIVGSAGGYRFAMTTPGGGSVPVSGLTMVGVLATHRRRGVLTALMRRHFAEARAEGAVIGALWASESPIYGRFGYGMGTLCAHVSIERERATFRRPVAAGGRFRLLDETEALALLPALWERLRPATPGMLSRSAVWWEIRRLGDYLKSQPPLQRVILEIDGRPEGYALYRLDQPVGFGPLDEANLTVIEALATSPAATAMVWRYLCDIDLIGRIETPLLPPSHPLFHLVQEPRRLRMTFGDGMWLRLLDVTAALAARTWGSKERLSFALEDAFCPENDGIYSIDGASGEAGRSTAAPELRLDAGTLGSLYLGGLSAQELADAGQLAELVPGAVGRADTLFRSARAPWCPEIF